MRSLVFSILFCFAVHGIYAAQPANMSGFFRSGQTFLTWCEDVGQTGETYRIYRHIQAITSGNLASATLIKEVKEGSSYFREMHNCDSSLTNPADTSYIDRFIIQPVTSGKGTQLSDTTGLFVYTVKEEAPVQRYYAVTTVSSGGTEEIAISTANSTGPVSEYKQYPDAVKYCIGPESADFQRDYYIMWLDHEVYNGYTGNAFPFAISNKNYGNATMFTSGKSPGIFLDGITSHFPGAGYSNYGNMDYGNNGTPTWYFGHHMPAAYDGGCQVASGKAMQDTIANYVQYKHMQAVLWARRHFNITEPKFNVTGNSMGASGAYGLIIAYPSFVTSIWANEGMTQYSNPGINGVGDTMWAGTIWGNYGHHSLANPVKFLPFNDPAYPGLDWVTKFNGRNVYDMRDVVMFLSENTHISFGCISSGHAFEDGSIKWPYQGAPFENYLKNSRHCFGYGVRHGDHNWGSAHYGSLMSNYMRWDESRPGFSNVPAMEGCEFNNPAYPDTGSRTYMSFVQWGTTEHTVLNGKKITETTTSWSIPIVNTSNCANKNAEYTVDITPRNLQSLEMCEGDTFTYQIKDATAATVEASGDIVVDSLQLLLIPGVPIRLSGAVASITLKSRGPNYPCADMDPPMHVSMRELPGPEVSPEIKAYPNPFNPETKIAVRGGSSVMDKNARIRIFSISGRCVYELTTHDSQLNAGITWNASSESSGVYIIKAFAGGKVLTKTITLIK
ncbi:MAG: hypothetical protein A2268_11435 [Candidatus Raymondbacteria bacterium RifOxyA12_full_50_37]|uniref:Secretion system C-terminal sorting domain-containing protein n=1 Tax=Candidatus Raymondbacteria bacterium RIFOXYD12_FULL_49_13 TaxID=1817890 RepID=A0A1F7FAB1_UNCRA|nr:MAG: hypothetical protein A2268_11435 [Candidatus Raymondbacteria bacterium RifOxyA12_full_50_37]OGJ92381.1 MAG: hypothetical protein A2248_10560 [Candidatus Raymondbacteria bacterium RIFOXYA2_FULL_49_16]OGJ99362.1 MAG: hypothetical protein A2453_13620 [Candidatus Raymondbacteria bacterium RIFOXYC2_FULL_50_21]OGK02682.1 MAG: hypothetical protein A2487_00990 [Candidatus Raymondbacteria bacterium RifOxyC12_full_50_8]OGK03624.1 MAG: hypothetical protein A2519_02500 [Candidatus Raymondbacteria b